MEDYYHVIYLSQSLNPTTASTDQPVYRCVFLFFVFSCLTSWLPLQGTVRWPQSCQAASRRRAAAHSWSVLSGTRVHDPTPPNQGSRPGTAQECSWWAHAYSCRRKKKQKTKTFGVEIFCFCATKYFILFLYLHWTGSVLSNERTRKHTPVLVNSKEVEPGVLVFFRAQHGDLVVDKHPVQALIWNRPWRKTVRKNGIETDHNSH